jgi:hypothetical protein
MDLSARRQFGGLQEIWIGYRGGTRDRIQLFFSWRDWGTQMMSCDGLQQLTLGLPSLARPLANCRLIACTKSAQRALGPDQATTVNSSAGNLLRRIGT